MRKLPPAKVIAAGGSFTFAGSRITMHLERGTAGNMFAALPFSEAWIT